VSLLALLFLALGFAPRALAEAILIPNGPLVGDGRTASTVRVWIPGLSVEEKIRLKPDQGKCGVPVVSNEGVLSFTVIPPKVGAPSTLGVGIQRKGAAVLEERVELALVPAFEGSVKITFDPPSLVAGAGTALVRLTPSSGTPQAVEHRRFLLTASVGTLEPASPAGDGSWVARYTPPANLTSARTVIVSAADAAAPDSIYGWAALPLQVKQSVTVTVEPDAKVVLKVGERSYGPIQASPVGTAAFQVDLDPATPTASVQAITKTNVKTNNVINLPRSEYGRVAILPLPQAIFGDPDRVSLPVRVVVTDFAGAPSKDMPTLRTTAGRVSPLSPIATEPGVFLATFNPPAGAGQATLTAEYGGFKSESSIRFVAPLPRLDLSVEPQEIPKNKTDFTVTVRVKDPGGTALVGRPPILQVQDATLPKPLKDNGDGTYTAVYKIKPKTARAGIQALPEIAASSLPATRLLLWTRMTVGPADGTTTVPVTVAALDRYGLPVPNVTITLATPHGDASLPPSVSTNAQGLAFAELRLGKQMGLVTLRAQSQGLVAEAPFFQVTQGKAPPAFDAGGDPDTITAIAAWQGAIASTAVLVEAGAVPAGAPASVTINTVPPYTTPGSAILATFRVADANGQPLPKARPTVTSTIGRVGAISNNGDGTFNVPIQLAPGVDGPLTLTVTAQAATQSLTLPTYISTLQAAAAEPAPTAGGAPSNQPTTGRSNQPRLSRDERPAWLRVQGGLGVQAHDYGMSLLEGPSDGGNATAPSEASFTNGNLLKFDIGGAPAGGISAYYKVLDTDFWAHLDATLAYELMSVLQTGYSDVGRNLRIDGRYRRPIKETPWYWYGLAGYHNTTALLFRYADETRSSATLLHYPVNGLRIGGGSGYEKGKFWFEAETSGTFAIMPVIWMLRLQAAYEFRPGNYAFLSFTEEARSMRFDFDDTGEQARVKDQQQPLLIGIGGAFR
jgi:hypothetical protein